MSREHELQRFLKLDWGHQSEYKNLKTDISVCLHFTTSSEISRIGEFSS